MCPRRGLFCSHSCGFPSITVVPSCWYTAARAHASGAGLLRSAALASSPGFSMCTSSYSSPSRKRPDASPRVKDAGLTMATAAATARRSGGKRDDTRRAGRVGREGNRNVGRHARGAPHLRLVHQRQHHVVLHLELLQLFRVLHRRGVVAIVGSSRAASATPKRRVRLRSFRSSFGGSGHGRGNVGETPPRSPVPIVGQTPSTTNAVHPSPLVGWWSFVRTPGLPFKPTSPPFFPPRWNPGSTRST